MCGIYVSLFADELSSEIEGRFSSTAHSATVHQLLLPVKDEYVNPSFNGSVHNNGDLQPRLICILQQCKLKGGFLN